MRIERDSLTIAYHSRMFFFNSSFAVIPNSRWGYKSLKWNNPQEAIFSLFFPMLRLFPLRNIFRANWISIFSIFSNIIFHYPIVNRPNIVIFSFFFLVSMLKIHTLRKYFHINKKVQVISVDNILIFAIWFLRVSFLHNSVFKCVQTFCGSQHFIELVLRFSIELLSPWSHGFVVLLKSSVLRFQFVRVHEYIVRFRRGWIIC